MNSLVSVIIPTFNRASFLKRAIDSVLNQTYHLSEVIVIDDGSTDDSLKLLSQYRDSITILKQDHQGVSAARNKGLEVSRGEYIAFLDSDDYWAPDKLTKQFEALKNHPDALVCYTWYKVVDPEGQVCRFVKPQFEGNIFADIYYSNVLITPHLLIHRSCFFDGEKIRLKFDTGLKVAEDYKIRLQLALTNRFCFVPDFMVFVTTHEGSTHNIYQVDEMVQCLLMVEDYFWHDPIAVEKLKKMGPRAKSSWSLEIAYMYLLAPNRRKMATRYLRNAIKLDPFYWRIYTAGVTALLIGPKNIDRILRFINQQIEGIK